MISSSGAWNTVSAPPRLSVVVPVYQTRAFLIAALNSIVSHAPRDVEILIVHDGGNDGSRELALDWLAGTEAPACLLDQPNSGLSAARMTGLRHARGLAVAFLDSDDIADPEVLLAMARDVAERGCDIVIARSAILDGVTMAAAPFYDSTVWDAMMGGQAFRRVTLAQEPRLLRLEPNANTRVISRAFLERAGIHFPIGRLFEDPPAHVRGVVQAAAVGLRNETLYLYRVNRAGKITDERSHRRFDAIETNREALAIAAAAHVAPAAGANLLIAASRMLFWCCQNVSNADRLRFAAEAAALMRGTPAAWQAHATGRCPLDRREALILHAFLHGDPGVIAAFAVRRRPTVARTLRFAATRLGGPVRRVLADVMRDTLRRPIRGAQHLMRRAVA